MDTMLVESERSVKVLNGEVAIGDTVAIAVGDGKSGSGMRIGHVLSFGTEMKYGRSYDVVIVNIFASSSTIYAKTPYRQRFPYTERIVKLSPMTFPPEGFPTETG